MKPCARLLLPYKTKNVCTQKYIVLFIHLCILYSDVYVIRPIPYYITVFVFQVKVTEWQLYLVFLCYILTYPHTFGLIVIISIVFDPLLDTCSILLQ